MRPGMHRWFASALAGAVVAAGAVAHADAPRAAHDDSVEQNGEGTIQSLVPGMTLTATRDVTLARATIRKGSRVLVTRVDEQQGRRVVDLELPDGYVLRSIAHTSVVAAFVVSP